MSLSDDAGSGQADDWFEEQAMQICFTESFSHRISLIAVSPGCMLKLTDVSFTMMRLSLVKTHDVHTGPLLNTSAVLALSGVLALLYHFLFYADN